MAQCTDNVPGLKQSTEDADQHYFSQEKKALMVGEHFLGGEGHDVSRTGAQGRENVGMSNHKADEKSAPRKFKVSVAMAIIHGLGGPKAMAKAAADGQPVNIPAQPYGSMEGRGSVCGAS